jgi:hypothetical protein
METTLSPVFLSYDMPPNLIVTSYRAIDPNCRNAFSWTKQYPTPKGYVSTTDFNPARSYILTKTSPDKIVDGWTCDGQWNWEDAPHRIRERLTKRMVEQYLGYVKKVQKVGSSWVLEGPHEVDSNDGSVSRLWLCADFSYCQLRGKDGVEVSISRKVQSSLSIWEEREKGLLTQDSKYLRVKVAISDDPNRMDSKEFVSWTTDTLNSPAWDGADLSVGEYWNKNGSQYTDEEMGRIPVVEVKSNSFGKTAKYPADKVYRVMTMDQWSEDVRGEMSKYLGLKPSDYLGFVKKAMRWLNGLKLSRRNIDETLPLTNFSYGWSDAPAVQYFDSRTALNLPNGRPLLNEKWRLVQHVRDFDQLHGRPAPSVDAYFCTIEGHSGVLPQLQNHANEIFRQIPNWQERVKSAGLFELPVHNQLALENKIDEFIQNLETTGRSVVVFSALPPKSSKQEVDAYKILKYTLTKHRIVHQNFQLNRSGSGLKKSANYATGQVNVFGILLKHGILPIPYICSIGDVDIISGIDVGRIQRNRSVAAVAVSITKSGHLWGTTPSGEPQTGETISESSLRRMFRKMVEDYKSKEDVNPKRILFVRDGNTPPAEYQSMKKVIEEYRGEMGIDFCWLSVRKQGCPRLLLFDENSEVVDRLPTKGHWLSWSDDSAWIWPTGSPNLKVGLPGIPQGINFNITENFDSDPLSIDEISKLLICHSHASQSQPYNSTRLPFVMHLADRQAKSMGNEETPIDSGSMRFSAA